MKRLALSMIGFVVIDYIFFLLLTFASIRIIIFYQFFIKKSLHLYNLYNPELRAYYYTIELLQRIQDINI
jgi:hypothetical protein